MTIPDWLTLSEIAKRYSKSLDTLRSLIRTDERLNALAVVRGSVRLYSPDAVAAIIQAAAERRARRGRPRRETAQ